MQEKAQLFKKLPLKEVLEYEKHFFEKILEKQKRAHNIELRSLKAQLRHNYLKVLNEKLKSVQIMLSQEFGHVLLQVQSKDQKIKKQQEEISYLKGMMRESEQYLTEMVRHQNIVDIEFHQSKIEELAKKVES